MEIPTEKASLFYEVYGTGPRHLFLFHGAGQDHTLFLPLTQALKQEYTCYAFDIFFHGQSHWLPIDQTITPSQWQKLIGILCERHGIETFEVLGYSIGSRFALTTLMMFEQRVRRLILIAPDAITISPWYKLATGTAAARWLFKKIVQHPGIFFKLADVLTVILPAQQRRFRFALRQMDTAEKRERIYRSWIAFRKLAFPPRSIAAVLKAHNIGLTVIVGKSDVVIPPQTANRLLRLVPNHTLHTLLAGHNRLIAEITENSTQYFG